jgi:hypothetical protein
MENLRLEIARNQIEFARRYTISLLEDIDQTDWFRTPAGSTTHVAWQVGHLAMAEYGLTMLRIRGKRPEDAAFISNDFIRCFKKGSIPTPYPQDYLPPCEIREVFDNVHRQALDELARYCERDLNDKLPAPHALFDTKLGSVFFCSVHEMLHAGQIGLLRRLLGKEPLR